MPPRLRVGRRRDDGAAAVEFALILILFLTLLFAMIQYGFYFWSAQSGSATTKEALRQVSVGNCQVQSELEKFINDRLGAARTSDAVVSRTYKHTDNSTTQDPAASNVGDVVTLTVTFDTLNLHFPFVPFLNQARVSRTDTARLEDTSASGTCS
jgi:Flp pilus assembly protein TadG